MSDFTWGRGLSSASEDSGSHSFGTPGLVFWETNPVTVRRVIVDWNLSIEQSVGAVLDPNVVETAVGLTLTSAASPTTPPAPSAGPIDEPGDWSWWWQGAPWRPIQLDTGSTSYYGAQGRIDLKINHEISGADNNILWFGCEVNDPSPVFHSWFVQIYWQVLTAPVGF